MKPDHIDLHGVRYRWPERPVIVVCIDGGDPAYTDHCVSAGIVPNIERFMETGFAAVAKGTLPSFTCPNNMSIVTGQPASVHGISGNFYLDRTTDEPVVMTGPDLLRAHSLMAEFSRHGAKVAAVTAKDKLRQQLQKNMDLSSGSVSFSSQHADRCTLAENGIENVLDFVGQPLPDMYSAELSLFVLDAGLKLLAERRPDILYLSLTDFIQHAFAPEHPEAERFYAEMDWRFGRMVEMGALVALTADHGMADKSGDDGTPNVIWLQDVLDAAFGAGSSRVICPITDAFVGHHGALGGFVRVYCRDGLSPDRVIDELADVTGIEAAISGAAAAETYQLPLDREGDVVVLADAVSVIGSRAEDHDLSALKGHRLRTHGSLHETRVPFILSAPLNEAYAARAASAPLRSHHLFDFALNGVG